MSASDRDGGSSPAPPKPLANLQNQVITAVRGAISGAMAGHEAGHDLNGLDLDFSVPAGPAPQLAPQANLPVLRAEPGRALAAVPPAAPPRQRRWLAFGLAAAMALVGLAAGIAIGVLREPPAPNAPPAPEAAPAKPGASGPAVPKAIPPVTAQPIPPPLPPPAQDNLETARGLVAAGHVTKARDLLLAEAATDRPEAALLLARSFDPNYLATLPEPDARPDTAEARRWYTRWYDLASKRGEVPQTMRLDLLLRSLDVNQ